MCSSLSGPTGSLSCKFLPRIDHLVYATPDLEATIGSTGIPVGGSADSGRSTS